MSLVTQGPIGPAAPGAPAPAAAGRGSQSLGQEEFLKLLITQLRFQDPINPSKPEEFAAQLAQFTSLERMLNIEKLLQTQADAGTLNTLAVKADLGASFIGRKVLAAGEQVAVSGDGPPTMEVEIGAGGGNAVLQLFDAGGREVMTRDLGFRSGGKQFLSTGSSVLPPGVYTYRVTVTAIGGDDVPVTTYTAGVVDGVSFKNGTVVLHAGPLSFPLDNVVAVEQVDAAGAGAAAALAASSPRIIPSLLETMLP